MAHVDNWTERFCEFELRHRAELSVASERDRNLILDDVRAEFRRMPERLKEAVLGLYDRLEHNAYAFNESYHIYTVWSQRVHASNHLTRPDPNLDHVEELKTTAEDALSHLEVVQNDIQSIIEVRRCYATGNTLAGIYASRDEVERYEAAIRMDLERANNVLEPPSPPSPSSEPPRTPAGHKVAGVHAVMSIRTKRLKDNFMNEPLDPKLFQGNWQGAHDLGGGMTKAGLWVRVDQYNRIIDRVVRKNMYMSRDYWYNPDFWHGHPKDIANRQPMEFVLQNRCASVSRQHFVRMRGFSQDQKNMILAQYVEYCPGTDLQYIQEALDKRPPFTFPEPACWMIFKQLVECCLIMRQGGIDTGHTWWRQIIHRDIKPPNIFLDEPSSNYFPLYPTPKMADFGLAIDTYQNDPLNPQAYNRGAGTKGYMAPEQMPFADSETGEPVDDWRLWDYTNVYGIGALMYSLICGGIRSRQQPTFLDDAEKWKIPQHTEDTYSWPLCQLVMSCIEWVPEQRATLEELQDEIRIAFGVIDNMSGASKGAQQSNEEYNIWHPRDDYMLGFAWHPQAASRQEQAPGASNTF